MLQKTWVKLFIWFMAIFFFFLAAGVVISALKPGPSENEAMNFMMGMMSAMDSSMMGVAMNIENDNALQAVIALSTSIALPIMLVSIVAGVGIRLWQRRDRNV
ncbi:MAG: hypothetical protein N3B21_09680 [Clostridia bacterium]|nr:hypothetical protein [Clostridia bacterium]